MRILRTLAGPLAVALLTMGLALPAGAAGYVLGPGDIINVTIRGSSEAERSDNLLTIAGDGTIDVEYAGRLTVTGKSTPEVQSDITRRLRDKQIFAAPQVSVNISEYGSQPVNVAGEVGNPMRVYLKGPTYLSDVLAEAGGIAGDTAGPAIIVRRRGEQAPLVVEREDLYGLDATAHAAANIEMRAHDDVFVTKKGKACVSGPVESPDCFDLEEGAVLFTFLALAGGLDETLANRESITIWRTRGGESKLEVSLEAIENGEVRPPRILEGDNIVVGIRLKVTVGGSVQSPGVLDFHKGMTISDAIAAAGGTEGTDVFGNLKNVLLRRGSESRQVNVKRIYEGADPDIPLEPGDKIHVRPKRLGI